MRITRMWSKVDPTMKTFPSSVLNDIDHLWKECFVPLNNLVVQYNSITGKEDKKKFKEKNKSDFEFLYQVFQVFWSLVKFVTS